jgi:hypothetical protein
LFLDAVCGCLRFAEIRFFSMGRLSNLPDCRIISWARFAGYSYFLLRMISIQRDPVVDLYQKMAAGIWECRIIADNSALWGSLIRGVACACADFRPLALDPDTGQKSGRRGARALALEKPANSGYAV